MQVKCKKFPFDYHTIDSSYTCTVSCKIRSSETAL